jgi:peptidoglycan/LPS O-acetylase OafA/YrhL
MLGGLLLGVIALYVGGAWLYSPSMIGPGYTWIAAFYLCLLLKAILQPNSWVARIARLSGLRYLGRISYGVYLLHQIIAGLTHGLLGQQPPQLKGMGDYLLTLLSLVLTLVVASLSWHWFERKLVARGHRLQYQLNSK